VYQGLTLHHISQFDCGWASHSRRAPLRLDTLYLYGRWLDIRSLRFENFLMLIRETFHRLFHLHPYVFQRFEVSFHVSDAYTPGLCPRLYLVFFGEFPDWRNHSFSLTRIRKYGHRRLWLLERASGQVRFVNYWSVVAADESHNQLCFSLRSVEQQWRSNYLLFEARLEVCYFLMQGFRWNFFSMLYVLKDLVIFLFLAPISCDQSYVVF